jgi:hypothetical protein
MGDREGGYGPQQQPATAHNKNQSEHEQQVIEAEKNVLATSWTCSRLSCFGGTPGGMQVSRKKPSRPERN